MWDNLWKDTTWENGNRFLVGCLKAWIAILDLLLNQLFKFVKPISNFWIANTNLSITDFDLVYY